MWRYDWQEAPKVINVYVDANWAGCKRTRKSTSGGTAMSGNHCIKTWSKTQSIVAKSSAESELFGVVRGSCEALGLATLYKDLGMHTEVRVHMDASAAKGIIERRGLSRVRHLDVDVLWLQEQEARRMLPLTKVPGSQNPADLMTKNVNAEAIQKNMIKQGLEFRDGRAESASQLHSLLGDHWVSRGKDGQWRRRHPGPRRILYCPGGSKKGPRQGQIGKVRHTIGRYANGEAFEVVDDLTKARPGKALRMDWTGVTVFYNEKPGHEA